MLTISILNTHLDKHNIFQYEYRRDIEDGVLPRVREIPTWARVDILVGVSF